MNLFTSTTVDSCVITEANSHSKKCMCFDLARTEQWEQENQFLKLQQFDAPK